MKFNLGNKFRVRNCEGNPWYNGKIGTVIKTGQMQETGHPRWDYLCSFDERGNYPFGLREMEKITVKNEQLLFPFMGGVT